MAEQETTEKPKRKYTRKVPPTTHTAAVADAVLTAAPPMPAPTKRSRVSIRERRLRSPFGEASAQIDFKDRKLVGRWFNTLVRTNQFHRALELGWDKVRPDMLENLDQLGMWHPSEDGFVTRGERGQEILMCMPQEDRDLFQAAKTKENNRLMGNPHAQMRQAAEALGKSSPEGAEFLDRAARDGIGGPIGGVYDQMERIERGPQAE